MAITEKNILMRSKDSAGNSILYYPITKADNVDGLDEALASANIQSDWNQTDPTAKDYIKNRIIYKDKSDEVVTIANGTLPATEDDNPGLLTITNESFTGFVEGESYTAIVDGVTVECTGQYVDGLVAIASFDLMAYILEAIEVTDGLYATIIPGEGLKSWALGSYVGKSISIEGSIYDIKKLPEDLLPDSVPTITDVEEYADSGDSSTLRSAKSYADSGDATTLESAKTYTDEQLAGASQIQFITWEADE